MNKLLKIALLLLLPLFTLAQQFSVTVTINAWNGTAKGYLSLPSDYNKTTKKYPVIFFFHGKGEAGTDSSLLLKQGLPQLLAGGMKLDSIMNPADSQQYSFIVLSLQNQYWSPDPLGVPYEVKWLMDRYRIDTSRLYTTGLSAGGEESFLADVTSDTISRVSTMIKATVSMSTATLGAYDSTMIGKYKIRTWFFSGDNDPYNFLPFIKLYNAQANRLYPGSSKLTVYPGGHGGWNTFYDKNWKDKDSLSIYQWMLMSGKQAPAPVILPPVKSLIMTIKIYSDGSIEKQ